MYAFVHSLAFMKGILPKYFSSEWSFAQYRVRIFLYFYFLNQGPRGVCTKKKCLKKWIFFFLQVPDQRTIVAFGAEKNSIIGCVFLSSVACSSVHGALTFCFCVLCQCSR